MGDAADCGATTRFDGVTVTAEPRPGVRSNVRPWPGRRMDRSDGFVELAAFVWTGGVPLPVLTIDDGWRVPGVTRTALSFEPLRGRKPGAPGPRPELVWTSPRRSRVAGAKGARLPSARFCERSRQRFRSNCGAPTRLLGRSGRWFHRSS